MRFNALNLHCLLNSLEIGHHGLAQNEPVGQKRIHHVVNTVDHVRFSCDFQVCTLVTHESDNAAVRKIAVLDCTAPLHVNSGEDRTASSQRSVLAFSAR